MLISIYSGFHFLDIGDSFRHVAWAATYYGNEAFEDPLGGCLSHFRQICSKFSVQLDYVGVWKKRNVDWQVPEHSPYLFVASGHLPDPDISQVLSSVRNGSNLVVLSPPWQLVTNPVESFSAIHERFLESLNSQLGFALQETGEEEYGEGRIFYINDNQINDLLMEPGPFGGGTESERETKEQKIKLLIERIATFKVSCIDCQVRSIPACWPQDEALVIEMELIQRGSQAVKEVTVTVEVPSSFEPLSTLVIEVQELRLNNKRSLVTVVVPRSQGIYSNPVTIRLTTQGKERQIFLPENQIEIISNLPELLRSSRPANVDLALVLPKYEAKLQPLATASTLIELLNIDPDAVVAKVRKIGEHLCKSICHKHLPNYKKNWTFAVITKQLFDAQVLNSKAKGYIDTIRVFGNMASHSDETNTTNFDREDALGVCYALVLFLKEVTEANLI